MAGLADIFKAIQPEQIQPTSSLSGLSDSVLKPDGDMIANILMDRIGDPVVVAGIMGNIQHETGGSFDASQKQYGGGPGRGLLQMEGDMLNAYNGYLKKNKLNDSPYSQVDFLDSILNGKDNYEVGDGHLDKLKIAAKKGNPAEYALQFSKRVERPKEGKERNDLRQKYAQEWFKKLQGEK
jgi:hypothetical protein